MNTVTHKMVHGIKFMETHTKFVLVRRQKKILSFIQYLLIIYPVPGIVPRNTCSRHPDLVVLWVSKLYFKEDIQRFSQRQNIQDKGCRRESMHLRVIS